MQSKSQLAQLENDGIDSDESDSDDDESGDDEEEANASGGLGAAINAIRFTSTLKKNAEQRAEEARKRWGATKGALQFNFSPLSRRKYQLTPKTPSRIVSQQECGRTLCAWQNYKPRHRR